MTHKLKTASLLPNNTFSGSTVSHIGQIFFDQSLSTLVQGVTPYKLNTQAATTNAADNIFAQEAALGDPVAEYSLLGSKVEDGIFAWIAFGIDVGKKGSINAAATFGENGWVANPNGGMFGPGGPGGFPGGAPTRAATSTRRSSTRSTKATATVE